MTAAAPALRHYTVGVRELALAERDWSWGKTNPRFTAYVRDIEPGYCIHEVEASGRLSAKWLATEEHKMNCVQENR